MCAGPCYRSVRSSHMYPSPLFLLFYPCRPGARPEYPSRPAEPILFFHPGCIVSVYQTAVRMRGQNTSEDRLLSISLFHPEHQFVTRALLSWCAALVPQKSGCFQSHLYPEPWFVRVVYLCLLCVCGSSCIVGSVVEALTKPRLVLTCQLGRFVRGGATSDRLSVGFRR